MRFYGFVIASGKIVFILHSIAMLVFSSLFSLFNKLLFCWSLVNFLALCLHSSLVSLIHRSYPLFPVPSSQSQSQHYIALVLVQFLSNTVIGSKNHEQMRTVFRIMIGQILNSGSQMKVNLISRIIKLIEKYLHPQANYYDSC